MLKYKKQYKQRSEEWYLQRKKIITASEASSCLAKTPDIMNPYLLSYNKEKMNEISETPKIINFFLEEQPQPQQETTKTNNNNVVELPSLDTKGCNPYMNIKEFYLKKCGHVPFKGNIATRHGQKYEDVASNIYSLLFNKKILEFGLLKHNDLHWLGASPDGITEDGIMLEIKCPYRRNITGIAPFYYWVQVQLQLEVCDLTFCDFLECILDQSELQYTTLSKFLEIETIGFEVKDIFDKFGDQKKKFDLNEDTFLKKGIFLRQSVKRKDKSEIDYDTDFVYYYPPYQISEDFDKLIDWFHLLIKKIRAVLTIQRVWKRYININKNKNKNIENDQKEYFIRPIFWFLKDIHISRIKRNQKWFSCAKPFLKSAFDEMKKHQLDEGKQLLFMVEEKKREKETKKQIQKERKVSSSSSSSKNPICFF